jgi:hypothetical protein
MTRLESPGSSWIRAGRRSCRGCRQRLSRCTLRPEEGIGLPGAVGVTWLQAIVQLCVVHLIRLSLRYASRSTGDRWPGTSKLI